MKKESKEFSKQWLKICILVSIIFTAASYVLSVFDKQTLESLSSTIIDTLWGASGISFVGYAIQNSVRAYTASKFGIPDRKEVDNNEFEGDNCNRHTLVGPNSNNCLFNNSTKEENS